MPDLIPIADPADARVAIYAEVRERDLVGRQGRFIAEGEVVVRTLLSPRSWARPDSLFLSDKAADALAPLLERAPAHLPVFVAAQAVMNAVVGFAIHRGVLATGRRQTGHIPEQLLDEVSPDALVLVLIGIANHDNVGGLFRNAAAFGVEAVLLDRTSCDPLYRKAIRVSVGATLTIPYARASDGAELLHVLEARGFDVLALAPAGAEAVRGLSRRGRTALIVGAEGPGLPASILERSRTARIPMRSGWDSLNVATAAGIALHHLAGDFDPP